MAFKTQDPLSSIRSPFSSYVYQRPGMDVDFLERLREERKTAGLAAQVGRSGRILTGVGTPPPETVKKQKESWLGKVFDVISRPLYAIEGLVEGAVEGDNPFALAGKGLWGTRKKTFSQLIKEKTKGVPVLGNKVSQAILGFAADVVGDPLTYVSVGSNLAARKGAEVTAKSAVGKAAVEVADSTTKKIIESATSKAVAHGIGPKATEKFVQKKLAEKLPEVQKLTATAMDAASKANPIPVGKAQFKFFGKTFAESEKAYKVGSAIAKQAGKSKTIRSAHRLLSTSARVPAHVKRDILAATNKGYFELENLYKEMQRELTSAVTDPETGQKLARKQIDTIMEQVPGMIEKGTIQNASPIHKKLADTWQKYRSTWFALEKSVGLHDEADELANYVYHIYRNSEEAEKYGLGVFGRKHVGTESPPFTQHRQFPDLETAEAVGLEPVKRIDEIMAYRAQKHYEVMSRYNFIERAKEYGVKLPDDATARGVVERELKKKGYKPGESRFLEKTADGKDAYWFDKEVAESIKFAERITARDPAAQHFIKLFDRVQNNWKFLAAVANPAAQVKNLYGDVFSNFMAGVVNPRRYKQAAKMVKKYRTDIGSEATQKFKIGNIPLNDREIDQMFTELGLKSGYTRAEFGEARGVVGKLLEKTGVGKVTGLVSKGARGVSEIREDFSRMALFLDALHKEGKGAKTAVELKAASQRAADTVRKYLFDYTDLTRFEKSTLRRIVPFYTFMRKNIPLQLELLATKPGRIATIPKSLRALQQATGVDSADVVYPGLRHLAPEWLREIGAVRVAENMSGIGGMYAAPDFPFVSAIQNLSEPSEMLGSISPLLKMPFELKQGKILRSGAPIKEEELRLPGGAIKGKVLPYLLSQLPQYRSLLSPSADLTSRLRFATGAPIYQADAKDIQSELRRIQSPIKTMMAELSKKRREKLGVPSSYSFKYP